MKILFICPDFPTINKGSNLYTDLAEELKLQGHNIKVVVAEEKKHCKSSYIESNRGFTTLRIRTGNIYDIGFVEKATTFLTINRYLKNGIKKFLGTETFDLILFHSQPVTTYKTVAWLMKKYKCKSYLMMKDIFPQNGVDIGLYSKLHPAYIFFRNQEKKLYKTATYIGCMSQENINYLINHNKYVSKYKFVLFPNTIKVKDNELAKQEKMGIRNKYNFNADDIILVFGGNFGKPQGMDFLIEVIDAYKKNKNVKFLLIGRGTEKQRIFNLIKEKQYDNTFMYDYIPRDDYEKILYACDIGLIFLDKRFTIPNYPSKTLSYFECSLPIMAAIDKNTDYGKDLEKIGAGFWVENGDIENYKIKLGKLISNKSLRMKMGKNGRNFLEKEWCVEKSVKLLEKQIGE